MGLVVREDKKIGIELFTCSATQKINKSCILGHGYRRQSNAQRHCVNYLLLGQEEKGKDRKEKIKRSPAAHSSEAEEIGESAGAMLPRAVPNPMRLLRGEK